MHGKVQPFTTTIPADASSFGLWAVLLEDHQQGEHRAVTYDSGSLNPTEKRYSQTEKALAVSSAAERLDQFVYGLQFDVKTDHHSQLTLLGSAELDMIPPCIQRIHMRLMRYPYRVLYVPRKLHDSGQLVKSIGRHS